MSIVQRNTASTDDASSDEWFARYLWDAGFLVALLLAAIGVSLYLDGGRYFRDWSQEPGAGFLTCMVLCPILAIVTLGFVIYAGVRVFRRPRSPQHVFVRLTLLVAYMFVLLVCADTVATTAAGLAGGFGRLASGGGSSWNMIQGRDFTGSQYDVREGSPDDASPSPTPFGPGRGGPPSPGRGSRAP